MPTTKEYRNALRELVSQFAPYHKWDVTGRPWLETAIKLTGERDPIEDALKLAYIKLVQCDGFNNVDGVAVRDAQGERQILDAIQQLDPGWELELPVRGVKPTVCPCATTIQPDPSVKMTPPAPREYFNGIANRSDEYRADPSWGY